MRLLNTATGQLEEFVGRNVPPYAALSHTWTESEVSLQQWSSLCSSSAAALPLPPDLGTDKILATCHLAAQDGLGHAWADTCCIDKSSSAELSEAINSMHAWYARSAICYVHLADLDPGGPADLETALPRCRWFTRGWTLQELIAPARVVFFDSSWTARAEKRDIVDLLARITGIRRGVLSHAVPLAALPTAEKMAWAARRQTTRLEDAAYCLLGLFGINMPLLYGEQERAFRRLQEEIMRTTTDLSIFAWQLPASSVNNGHHNNASSEFTYSGFLAPSPEAFYPCRITSKMAFGHEEEFSVTNCGIKTRIRIYLHMAADNPANKTYLFPVQWDRRGRLSLGVRMKKCGADRYAREDPHQLVAVDGGQDFAVAAPEAQKYLLTDLPAAADGSGIMTRAQLHGLRGQVVQLYSVGAIAISDFWPAARCDSQQEVFFTGGNSWLDATVLCCSVWATGSAAEGGSSSSISADHDVIAPRGPTFALVCFVVGWAGGRTQPPQVSLVPVGGGGGGDEEGRGSGVVTEEFLRKMKSKDDGSARLRRHLRFMGVPRQREVRFGVGDGGREVRVSYEVERAVDGDVCEGEFWRVRVVSETRMVMEDYRAVDEGWGEVDGAKERALRTSSLSFNAKGKRRADSIEDFDNNGNFLDESPDAKVARRLTRRGV